MELGATDVVITKEKGFEAQYIGQLDLIIVRPFLSCHSHFFLLLILV